MTTSRDVGAYILGRTGPLSAMKLQKLVYYSQAWHLALFGRPLFAEPIEAWAQGPVVPDLFRAHRGQFVVERIAGGDATAIDAEAEDVIDRVLSKYGRMGAERLSELTHAEAPWLIARQGVPGGHRSKTVITPASMAEFYRTLDL